MKKIFIKSIIALALCVNIAYGVEYLPSTSPNVKVIKGEQKVQQFQKGSNVITFSEFSNGTYITDQYANKGIIFKGDSPFITSDGSNPTSPVLSGSPRFNGAMEGHFVDPTTHEPTTVSHFELDAGYFDNLSSTKLSWYNSNGDLIRQVLDSKFKIQHFTVNDEGIAYFRIEIIAQEDAGYAIDNISFEIKDISLDKITHQAGSPIANTFTIYLKSSNKALKGICDYKFFVEDSNQKIEGTGCQVKDDNSSKVNFKITKSPYNLENAKVTMCKNSACKEIKDIKEFSVYSTDFNVKKDGFSFENGDWHKYYFIKKVPCWVVLKCTEEHKNKLGSMKELVDSLKEFLPSKKQKTAAKDIIGFHTGKDKYEGGAMCHGLAVSALANFNNSDESLAWGSDLNSSKTKNEIVSIFQKHWDNRDSESAKPFSKKVNDYNINNFEDAFYSVGKIAYYYTSQSSYSGGKAWVGKHELKELNNVNTMNVYHKESLKLNDVSLFSFDILHLDGTSGGHSIIATTLIKYKNNEDIHSVYVLHDNNFINSFVMLDFINNFILEKFIYEKDLYNGMGDNYDSFKDFHQLDVYGAENYNGFDTFSKETDKLHVYGKSNHTNKQQKLTLQKVNNSNETFDYQYPNHISITIVGGKLLKITDTQTQKEVILNPIIGTLERNKAYLEDDMILTEFLLPKNSIYKIELQKYKQYPELEVYAQIPTDAGKVEIINYENLATNKDDTTLAHFLVGNGNNEKAIKREGESNVAPTYDEAIDMKITSATFIKAVSLNSGVKLTWNLPDNPNLEEVVVVRKENSKPTSMTDGSEVYKGIDETYTDSSARNNREYYYGIYTIAKNGDVTDGQFIYVNTHQATLFGFVKDTSANPVKNAEVVLKNGVGLVSKVIATEITDKNGYFSFGNIPLGTYLLEFSHSNYTFSNNNMTINLENKNMEISQEAIGQPLLAMNANMVMKINETETISWDGLNIADEEKVNIKLKRNNSWETLASDVEFSKHAIHWKVTEPKDDNATLKIELSSNSAIFSEKKIYIFGADELKYDFNNDGIIDIKDIMKVASLWTTKSGDNSFDTTFDLNKDGVIDIKDIMLIASKWKV